MASWHAIAEVAVEKAVNLRQLQPHLLLRQMLLILRALLLRISALILRARLHHTVRFLDSHVPLDGFRRLDPPGLLPPRQSVLPPLVALACEIIDLRFETGDLDIRRLDVADLRRDC